MEFNEQEFWHLIDLAQRDFAAFKRKLEGMTREQLIGFHWKFDELAGELYKPEFGVNYPSEDAFEDLAAFVVGQGKVFYQRVLSNPREMPSDWDRNRHGIDIPGEASNVYYERFGDEIPIYDG